MLKCTPKGTQRLYFVSKPKCKVRKVFCNYKEFLQKIFNKFFQICCKCLYIKILRYEQLEGKIS